MVESTDDAKSKATETPQDDQATSSQPPTAKGTAHQNRDGDLTVRDGQASVAAAAEKLEAKLHDEEWNSQPSHADRPWAHRSNHASVTNSDSIKDDSVGQGGEGSAAAAAERLEAKLLEEEWNDRGRV
jgi:hypothetical protein